MKLKVGQRLYRVIYYNGLFHKERKIKMRKIVRVFPKAVKLSYDGFIVKKDNIDVDDWFTSEIKALKGALERHEDMYEDPIKEIARLKKLIKKRREGDLRK